MRLAHSIPLMALIRGLLDLSLIGSWIWLASASLPQPVPALGAALFGAASAGYWAMSNLGRASNETEQEIPRRQEQVGRLTKFASRPDGESADLKEEWFNTPELGRRMQAAAEQCAKLSEPMSVIFARCRPTSLADWSEGNPPKTLADVLPRLLDGSRQKYVTGAKGREAVIALVGANRPAADELLKQVCRQLDSAECEAGIVIYPDDGVEPPALASVARLRLRPLANSASTEPALETDLSDANRQQASLTTMPGAAQEQADTPRTAVS
jgi:hypothetical protein